MKPTRIPPMQCPSCQSTLCYKNSYGTLICEACRKAHKKNGKTVRTDLYEESESEYARHIIRMANKKTIDREIDE